MEENAIPFLALNNKIIIIHYINSLKDTVVLNHERNSFQNSHFKLHLTKGDYLNQGSLIILLTFDAVNVRKMSSPQIVKK